MTLLNIHLSKYREIYNCQSYEFKGLIRERKEKYKCHSHINLRLISQKINHGTVNQTT